MSSALAMVLMAATAVPGNGPEMVSGEMEQGLDLCGEWECPEGFGADPISPVRMSGSDLISLFEIVDEGAGKIRLAHLGCTYLGIYIQSKSGWIICFREAGKGRATSFRAENGQERLILHRVKPRK